VAHPDVLEATTVDEAVDALATHGYDAKVLAGGTAVMILLRARLIEPALFVSIGRIEGLHEIKVEDGKLSIGALVTLDEVDRSPVVREAVPGLAEVFGVVANIRVRCAATVGGLLAEADYASDPPCALLALDAEVAIGGRGGTRVVPLADFLVGYYQTALEPDELVLGVRVPLPEPGAVTVYEKFRTRSSEDRPCVGVFASATRAPDGSCASVRLAIGAVSERPERFPDLEETAVGTVLDEGVARQIADGYAERIKTIDDMRGSSWYRTEMVRVWGRRALLEAAQPAAGETGAG
jgi:aerobic carbon-monoxide dehydrogenase medium subunit